MSNRTKGYWGVNPTNRPQYQRRPRHVYRNQDVKGCLLVGLAMIMAAVLAAAKTIF